MDSELNESERLLRRTFESLQESVILVDPQSRQITDCNKATEELFGYSKDELIGSSTQILHVDDQSYQAFHEENIEQLEQTGSIHTEFKLKKKSGEIFDSDHTVTFVYDDTGDVQRVVSVVRDISTQKQYQQQLENSLSEKKVLLQEVHHRVKNNLALVISFLWLQMTNVQDKYLRDILEKNILRVQSIALIHDILYQSKSLANIPLRKYFNELIEAIKDTIDSGKYVSIEYHCDNIIMNANQAIPAALVTNELITNALKHAFPGQKNGKIWVTIREEDNKVQFAVKDNGIGMQKSFDESDYGLGFNIINTLMRQLEAELNINGANGTEIIFTFEKKTIKGAAGLNLNLT